MFHVKTYLEFCSATAHIPGNFIPAMRRAKLGCPICLNIFFICAYCEAVVDFLHAGAGAAGMRLRRLPVDGFVMVALNTQSWS